MTDIPTQLAHAMIEQAADAIIFADVHGVIQVWNRAAVLTFGFEATEALGQSLDLIIPEHLRAAHWAGFHRAMESGKNRRRRGGVNKALCQKTGAECAEVQVTAMSSKAFQDRVQRLPRPQVQ